MTAYALQCRDELCVTVRGDGCQTHIFGCQSLAQILLKVWKAYSVRTLFTEHLSFSEKKKKKKTEKKKKAIDCHLREHRVEIPWMLSSGSLLSWCGHLAGADDQKVPFWSLCNLKAVGLRTQLEHLKPTHVHQTYKILLNKGSRLPSKHEILCILPAETWLSAILKPQ